MLMCR